MDGDNKRMDFTGRVAIVTGGSRGLGQAVASCLLAKGARVAIGARDEERLRVAAEELRNGVDGDRLLVARLDVADSQSCRQFVAAVGQKWQRIDILVNNAGVHGGYGRLDQLSDDDWHQALAVNLLGTVRMTKLCLPYLLRSDSGRVVNLSGGGAAVPFPGFGPYAASKAAVVRLTETWAVEYAGSNVRFNAVAPGALNTRLLDQVLAAGPGAVGEENYRRAVAQQQSGGASLTEAAELCAFLASPASDHINGRLISAVWDNWRQLTGQSRPLPGDLFTLRRVVPAGRDSGMGDRP
ncbi:MAG: SDR family oxidoreductase [Negativicutes bacterium]|nr:SDR family oxidoreductase [Negativicutes bacterium]